MPPDSPLHDPYAPREIARLVTAAGVAKAAQPLLPLVVLGLLAGAFIAFGAMFYTVAVTDSGMGWGPTRVLGGAAFSLGLILVVVGGAELFTGNNLLAMAWASRQVGAASLLRNWGVVYLANFAGAAATAVLVAWSGTLELDEGAVARTAAGIASAKVALDWGEAFVRGILCNTLVCLAVWLAMGARSAGGKILAILFPITAFVALGFEHSVANMYFLPLGWLLEAEGVTPVTIAVNLLPVTAGNVVGGGILVALVYWLVYLRPGDT